MCCDRVATESRSLVSWLLTGIFDPSGGSWSRHVSPLFPSISPAWDAAVRDVGLLLEVAN